MQIDTRLLNEVSLLTNATRHRATKIRRWLVGRTVAAATIVAGVPSTARLVVVLGKRAFETQLSEVEHASNPPPKVHRLGLPCRSAASKLDEGGVCHRPLRLCAACTPGPRARVLHAVKVVKVRERVLRRTQLQRLPQRKRRTKGEMVEDMVGLSSRRVDLAWLLETR